MDLLQIPQLIFVIFIGISVCLAAGAAFGVGDFDAGDADGGIELDTDDPNADVLDMGRVPITLLAFMWTFTFGLYGLIGCAIAEHYFTSPLYWGFGVLAGAWALASVTARTLSGFLLRVMPRTETHIVTKAQYSGCIGTTVTHVDEDTLKPGIIDITDNNGELQRLRAVCIDEDLPRGKQVVIVDKLPDCDVFIVAKCIQMQQIENNKPHEEISPSGKVLTSNGRKVPRRYDEKPL